MHLLLNLKKYSEMNTKLLSNMLLYEFLTFSTEKIKTPILLRLYF
jgi:hypothetical protein